MGLAKAGRCALRLFSCFPMTWLQVGGQQPHIARIVRHSLVTAWYVVVLLLFVRASDSTPKPSSNHAAQLVAKSVVGNGSPKTRLNHGARVLAEAGVEGSNLKTESIHRTLLQNTRVLVGHAPVS